MKSKRKPLTFDQTLELLGKNGFEVSLYVRVARGFVVTKYGVGAVLVPAQAAKGSGSPVARLAVHPGVMVKGEVSRLVDRGYQKFIRSSQYELPASAYQLQAIHTFSEELKQLTGATSLYNESLGTTSDVYRYDRLKGRGTDDPEPTQPWALTDGH
jgi:hypothetical protein